MYKAHCCLFSVRSDWDYKDIIFPSETFVAKNFTAVPYCLQIANTFWLCPIYCERSSLSGVYDHSHLKSQSAWAFLIASKQYIFTSKYKYMSCNKYWAKQGSAEKPKNKIQVYGYKQAFSNYAIFNHGLPFLCKLKIFGPNCNCL